MTKRTFEEMKDFAIGIDLCPLLEKVAEVLGQKDLVFQSEITENESRDDVRIYIYSEDIKDSCGLFGKSCNYLKVHTWNGTVYQDEETGYFNIFWNFKFGYSFRSGGSNGSDTGLYGYYYEDKGFAIRIDGEPLQWNGGV